MLQTAWDGTVDNDAFVRAVAGLVGALTGTVTPPAACVPATVPDSTTTAA